MDAIPAELGVSWQSEGAWRRRPRIKLWLMETLGPPAALLSKLPSPKREIAGGNKSLPEWGLYL